MTRIILLLIRSYQIFIAPLLGTNCRFQPSCSSYCKEALQRHGLMRGLRLGTWRLLRCQPFARAGYDPVPSTDSPQPSITP